MKPAGRNFDGFARIYRALEWLAFGSDLEAARFCHLEKLRGCGRVLILGEGDGRFLEKLVRRFPEVSVECVDLSPAMLARARARLTEAERERVVFRQADARTVEFEAEAFDAVVTLFFLDCFTEAEVGDLVDRLGRSLRAKACWLWADFALPARGWRRWRARAWLSGLYLFFRWSTGMTARQLPAANAWICAAGFILREETFLQAGLLRSTYWERRMAKPTASLSTGA